MSRNHDETRIISPSTVLILSGFIIGLTVDQLITDEMAPYLLAAGLSGFVAFIALDLTSTRRVETAIKEEQEQIEGRLDRHTLSLTSVGFSLDRETEPEIVAPAAPKLPDVDRDDQLVSSV